VPEITSSTSASGNMATRGARRALLLIVPAAAYTFTMDAHAAGMPHPPLFLPTPDLANAPAPDEENMKCLKSQAYGCSEIMHPGVCIRSRDGRSKTDTPDIDTWGSPCVWCGGGVCTGDSKNKCEPLSFLQQGEQKGHFKHMLNPHASTIATCEGIVPVPEVNYDCLTWKTDGCAWIKDKNECLHSRDGQKERNFYSANPGWGEPCIWCGGGVCTDEGGATCQSFDYLMNGFQLWYKAWHTRAFSTFAVCDNQGRATGATLGGEGQVTLVADEQWRSEEDLGAQPPREGRFITNGEETTPPLVWWYCVKHYSKHPVSPETDCDACGCRENLETLPQADIDVIPHGEPFACDMLTSEWKPLPIAARSEWKPDAEVIDPRVDQEHFVTQGSEVWHYTPADNSKHLVPADMDCQLCGCEAAAEEVSTSMLDSMMTSSPFACRSPTRISEGTNFLRPPRWDEALLALLLLVVLGAVALWGYLKYRRSLKEGGEDSISRGISLEDEEGLMETPTKQKVVFEGGAFGPMWGVIRPTTAKVAVCKPRNPITPVTAPRDMQSPGIPQDVFDLIDKDGDGQITREEWQKYAFDAIDRNHDGAISSQEWQKARTPVRTTSKGPMGAVVATSPAVNGPPAGWSRSSGARMGSKPPSHAANSAAPSAQQMRPAASPLRPEPIAGRPPTEPVVGRSPLFR